MKTPRKPNITKAVKQVGDAIAAYDQAQSLGFRSICNRIRELIEAAIPKATSKVWHGSPVWFIDDNPVVGYNVTAKTVNLLFWNGRAFDEDSLKPVGKYYAAQAVFGDIGDVNATLVRRWLRQAKAKVFDSRAFFKELRGGK